ncbi:glycosyltransferase family 1 protein [Arthrobacter sp. efr-133-TYG-104]|uniref:glycosyltransferase family 1 protein n=1 Tax=Arthrobacter sp. efr-133-TYG-104 TaxID=3040324 RepID=UPI00254A0321|nr:glycosyltransferase family 1 protein [Arthrobacter sp. efr-133-TYG-104]
MTMSRAQLRHLALRLRQDGWGQVARHGTAKAATFLQERWGLAEPELPLRPEDVADPSDPAVQRGSVQRGSVQRPEVPFPGKQAPLNIGWVCTPPGPGSGGHTTLFRMVHAMEERGHRCTLFLYDRTSDDVSRHEPVIRRHWPNISAEVRSATDGMAGMDALVASSWSSAHVIAARAPRQPHVFYFIQDYEPYFHPRGILYALAEDSYRFGYTTVALGDMIAQVMKAELGTPPDAVVPYGCDTTTYRLLPTTGAWQRTGVVYYAKRNVDRRGYLLAKLALERFHQLCPDKEIHVYGDIVSGWKIPITNHGNLPPRELNILYNHTIAGLAISFTNISLVPGELLAAGNVPVLNQAPFASGLLTDPDAVWAPSRPDSLATALAEVVCSPNIQERAARIGSSQRLDWSATAEAFGNLMQESLVGQGPA